MSTLISLRNPASWIAAWSASLLKNGGFGAWQQLRWKGKKIRRKKGPVEALSDSPNSVAAMLSERVIPNDMDLHEIWDKATDKRLKALEKLDNIDSSTRFTEGSSLGATNNALMLDKGSADLSREDVNRLYYSLQKGSILEAFRDFYRFLGSDAKSDVPVRGCKALYDSFQMTGTLSVLYRKAIHTLKDAITDEVPKRIWLDGKSGSGKSIALISLVEWARQNNWLVLYLPSASALVSDYFFAKRGGEELYDTINVARDILRSVHGVYGGDSSALSSLKLTESPSEKFGKTLEDLCKVGLRTIEPVIACEAVAQLLREFVHGNHDVEKLVVIDDYNAMYWRTNYYKWLTQLHKVPIRPREVALVKAFRVMDDSFEPKCHIVAAPTYSAGIPDSIVIPMDFSVQPINVPLFSEDEVHCALCHYWEQGLIQPLDPTSLKRLYFITRGNMHEIRRSLAVL